MASSRVDGRAPYKPLLILTALGAVTRDEPRLRPWTWWRDRMLPLCHEFGRWRDGQPIGKPLNPFGYLQSDGIWEIQQFVPGGPMATKQKGSRPSPLPKKSWLDEVDPLAGLTRDAWTAVQDPVSRSRVVLSLLSGFFDAAIWSDVLDYCGIDEVVASSFSLPQPDGRRRDPAFRGDVLAADGGVCVFCGWDATNATSNAPIAVDAAHVKWRQYDGPDALDNGVTACARCHRLFDRGYYGFAEPGGPILVSTAYSGPPLPSRTVPGRIGAPHCSWQVNTKFKG